MSTIEIFMNYTLFPHEAHPINCFQLIRVQSQPRIHKSNEGKIHGTFAPLVGSGE